MLSCLSAEWGMSSLWVSPFLLVEEILHGTIQTLYKVQPKCQESEEIPGLSVHLILEQHCHWYPCLDISFSSLLSLTITILFGFPHRCSYFQRTGLAARWWRAFPGEARNAAVFNVSDPAPPSWADCNWQPLLVIELLHFPSRLSHAPMGALHTASESRESPLCRTHRTCDIVILREISLCLSLWLSRTGHHRVFQRIMRH